MRRPDLTIATTDHSTPTTPRGFPIVDKIAATQVEKLIQNCKDFGIHCYPLGSDKQGIVHVIGPELGLTQPGMTVVCGDSHTATHGALGALAFGIGTSEVEHVLATQCLLLKRSKTYQVRVDGALKPGVSAKDIILALIARIGIGGGTGSIFEYCGSAIRSLSMEERMTVCNMSIEARRARRLGGAGRHHVSICGGPRSSLPRARRGMRRWRAGGNCRPTTARRTTRAS